MLSSAFPMLVGQVAHTRDTEITEKLVCEVWGYLGVLGIPRQPPTLFHSVVLTQNPPYQKGPKLLVND